MLERSGRIDRLGRDAIFLEVDDAVDHYLRARGAGNRGDDHEDGPPDGR
jgi:hypothetical protein